MSWSRAFLKELKTDYIDLLLLHCVTDADWPEQLRKQMDIMSKLKSQGKIRALGVSCHSIAALEAAAAEPWVESVHTRINPYGMSMDGSPGRSRAGPEKTARRRQRRDRHETHRRRPPAQRRRAPR